MVNKTDKHSNCGINQEKLLSAFVRDESVERPQRKWPKYQFWRKLQKQIAKCWHKAWESPIPGALCWVQWHDVLITKSPSGKCSIWFHSNSLQLVLGNWNGASQIALCGRTKSAPIYRVSLAFLAEKEQTGLIVRMTESQTLYWLWNNRCHSSRQDSCCLSCLGSGFIIHLG